MRLRKYTDRQLRSSCCEVDGCTNQARYQWSICSDGNQWRRLCSAHDLELNAMILEWAKFQGWKGKLRDYKSRVRDEKWNAEGQS